MRKMRRELVCPRPAPAIAVRAMAGDRHREEKESFQAARMTEAARGIHGKKTSERRIDGGAGFPGRGGAEACREMVREGEWLATGGRPPVR